MGSFKYLNNVISINEGTKEDLSAQTRMAKEASTAKIGPLGPMCTLKKIRRGKIVHILS